MSFLKRLLGLKPTREEFAQLMLRAMADAGDAAWRFDQGDYALRHAKDARVFFLANAFAEYCSAPRDQRAPMVKRLTQIQLVDSPDMALETVRWSVLPRVRERLYFEMVRLTTLMMVKAAAQHHVPLADAVSVAFCVDFPDRILELNAETLRGWSISTQELSQLALHNLRQRSENTFVPVAPGVFASRWRDNHDASRILLTHEIERLGVKGHPVATIPNRDHLIITGSQDVAGLQTLITATGKILEEPRPMLAVPFILQDGAWAAFRPPADHPLHATIEQAWLDTRLMEYAEQKSLMDKLHDMRGQGVAMPAVYDPVHYGASQEFGRTLRSQGSAGIAFDSVRRPSGQCAAIFKPKALSNARAVGHIGLHWDGRAISHWFEKGAPRAI